MKTDNEDVKKYETKNPISIYLLKNFFDELRNLMKGINPQNIFEAGCGCGYVTELLKNEFPRAKIIATDIDDDKLSIAKERIKNVQFSHCSIYDTKQKDNFFDLVISTEVLEHLDDPLTAMKELNRISNNRILVSTPNEPIWRMANVARLKYLPYLGNTPGHINHWNKRSLCELIQNTSDVDKVKTPLPWVIVLCRKRNI